MLLVEPAGWLAFCLCPACVCLWVSGCQREKHPAKVGKWVGAIIRVTRLWPGHAAITPTPFCPPSPLLPPPSLQLHRCEIVFNRALALDQLGMTAEADADMSLASSLKVGRNARAFV